MGSAPGRNHSRSTTTRGKASSRNSPSPYTALSWGAVTRSRDSDAPPSPDQAEPGGPARDPRQRRRRRGGVLAATAGGAALAAVVGLATLACSHQGGLPATAAAGTGQASTGTSQPGAAAASPQQSLMLVPAPDGATATGPGSTHGGTGASPP